MKYDLRQPCDQCPFLNGSGFTKESLDDHASGEFPCHKQCIEKGGVFVERKNGRTNHCAGALIYLEKRDRPHQMMRICERIGLYDRTKLDMNADVQ